MNHKEFESWVADKVASIGLLSIESNSKSLKPFTMGCYFDEATKKYKVYSNDEHSTHTIYLETDNEDEAYAELQSMVVFEQRNNKGYI